MVFSSTEEFRIDLDLLEIPAELIWFEAPETKHSLLLNPELGTFLTCRYHIFQAFMDFVRDKDSVRRSPELSTPLKEALALLIIKRVIYYGNYTPYIDETTPEVPESVYWETTFGCTLRCVYCYMSAELPKPDELSTEEAMTMIKDMADLGVKRLVFTGGEPLLRKDIWQLSNEAKEHGLQTQIITNATLIKSESIANQVKQHFDYIITSLDGACPEHNDPHRGKGSFDSIVRGIRILNQVGVEPIINSVISNRNIDQAKHLLNYVERNFKVKSHRMMHLSRIGRGGETEYEMENWNDYKKLHQVMIAKLFENEDKVPEVLTATLKRSQLQPKKNCGMGSGEIYINSKGHVYPCKLVTTSKWHLGNIRETPLAQILKDTLMQKVQNLSVMDIKGCRSCMIRRLCGGGCRGNHLGVSGDALKNNPQFCWTLRHRMIAQLWTIENKRAILEDMAYVPRVVSTGKIWEPEIGTALPTSELLMLPMIN